MSLGIIEQWCHFGFCVVAGSLAPSAENIHPDGRLLPPDASLAGLRQPRAHRAGFTQSHAEGVHCDPK